MLKISIVTVCYNAEKTIENTILSVINQNYKNIEYIIIDGNSTDNTINIIKKYSDKISYWISEKDKGIYNAMNKGIDVANGDYIQFLNADDMLVSNNTIAQVALAIEDEKYPDILSSKIWNVYERSKYQRLASNNVSMDDIKKGGMLPHPGIFMKINIIRHYKFNEDNRIASDFELLLRCALDNRSIKYITVPTVYFSSEGISSVNPNIGIDECYNILKKYRGTQVANDYKQRVYKYKIKFMLNKIGILHYIKCKLLCEKHKCNNKFCRWCNSANKGGK